MKLIVGLGNPGPKYLFTRHNAGFIALDLLAVEFDGSWQGTKFDGEVGRATVFGEDCWLLKPMTFMNVSGRSVAQALRFYKIAPEDLIVLHDDIDVPAGKVKARVDGSAGGNNGVASIIAEIGTDKFNRIKLGVGKPGPEKPMEISSWVLEKMSPEELEALRTTMFEEMLVRLKGIFQQRGAVADK